MIGALLLILVGSYLLGSVPTGLLVSQFQGLDIRLTGSGNTGATNIYRVLGLKPALFVAVFDVLKGFLPTYIATLIFTNMWFVALVAFTTVIGHVFSIFLNFKGGKGVATYAGTLAVLLGPIALICLLAIWGFAIKESKIMSLTNLALAGILPFVVLLIAHSLPIFTYTLTCGILIFWTHRENISRLKKGEEKTLELPF